MRPITIWHSPDNDDQFYFWPIRHGLIDLRGFEFEIQEADTEALNRRALSADSTQGADIIAISAAVFPKVEAAYEVLSSGASIGRQYGPVVVATRDIGIEELARGVVGIPGDLTTAAAILRLALPAVRTRVIPIQPYEAVFEALDSGKVDAAVLIHEGQILFESMQLRPILDLGAWWSERTSTPLVLGINVIHRRLGTQLIEKISALCEESVEFALNHREQAIDYLVERTKRRGLRQMTREDIGRYLGMYANEDSKRLTSEARQALGRLISEVSKAG